VAAAESKVRTAATAHPVAVVVSQSARQPAAQRLRVLQVAITPVVWLSRAAVAVALALWVAM